MCVLSQCVVEHVRIIEQIRPRNVRNNSMNIMKKNRAESLVQVHLVVQAHKFEHKIDRFPLKFDNFL